MGGLRLETEFNNHKIEICDQPAYHILMIIELEQCLNVGKAG